MGAQPGNTLFNGGVFGGDGGGGGISGAITCLNLLTQAYRVAFILRAPQRRLSPEQIQDGYEVANNLLDQWNAQSLTVICFPRIVKNIQASQQDYLIGLGAVDAPGKIVWDDVIRPVQIADASTILESNQPTPLELPMTMLTYEQWKDIPLKQTTSTFPLWAYYEPQFPWGIFHVWPVPQESNQVALYLPQRTSLLPADSSTQLVFPPGWQKALIYVTAYDLCCRWGKTPPPDVEVERNKALSWIKAVNAPLIDAICDPGVQYDGTGRNWNYFTGDWQRR